MKIQVISNLCVDPNRVKVNLYILCVFFVFFYPAGSTV
jgi:hypothetical protein